MNEEQLKPIKETNVEIKPAIINLPPQEEKLTTNTSSEEIIQKLPSWNIEPPIEIKRGN